MRHVPPWYSLGMNWSDRTQLNDLVVEDQRRVLFASSLLFGSVFSAIFLVNFSSLFLGRYDEIYGAVLVRTLSENE